MRIASGVVDQVIFFVAVDATDLKTRKTGLTSFTVYRARDTGAATAYTTPTVAELSAANMPGVYSLLLDEDMTIAAGNETEEIALHITQASMAPVTRTIELYRPKITAGNTLDVTATGAAGVDWGNVENPSTANALSSTSIATAAAVTTVNGLAANVITATAINAGAITNAKFAAGAIDAAAIAADAIGASELAADAVTEIAAGIWGADATTYQTQGTFGQAIGDPVADANTIYKAVVTDATAATVGLDVVGLLARIPAALVGGKIDANLGSVTAGVLVAASFAAGAFDAVWTVAARILTAGTNIALAKGVGVTGFTDLDAAGVRTAVGLASANLDTQISGVSNKLPAALVGGKIDANVGSVTAGAIAAAAFAANALDAVWSTAARILTAGTNIVLAKGTGVTGLNDLDAAGIRTAAGLATANLDTQLSGLSGKLPAALVGGRIDANVGGITAGIIVAASFAAGALDAVWSTATRLLTAGTNIVLAKGVGVTGLNDPTAAANAAAVWDLDATAHQTQGTFGQAIGDPVADAHTIYGGVVTDATGVNVAADVVTLLGRLPAALVGGRVDSNVGSVTAGAIAAAAFAANALDAVWSTAIRLLTAGTNIVLAKGVGVTGLNDLDAAGVRGAVGLAGANLDTQLAAVQSDTDNIQTRLPAALVGGRMASDVGSIAASEPSASNIARTTQAVVLGVVGVGSTTVSIVTTSLDPAAAVTNQFKDRVLTFDRATTTANLRGQATSITASTAGGGLTVSTLTDAPVNGDTFTIT